MLTLSRKTLFFSAHPATRMTTDSSRDAAISIGPQKSPASNLRRTVRAVGIWPHPNYQKDLMNRFLFAASRNDILVVQLLLNPNTINCTNQRGQTALMLATIAGNYSIVQLLINKGANVLVSDKYGFTSLMYAIEFLHKNIIFLLLAANASIFHTNRSGISAFSLTILPQINNLRRPNPKAKKMVREIILNEIGQLVLMEYYRLTAQIFIDSRVGNLQNFVKFIIRFAGNPTDLQIRRQLILDFICPLLKEITLPIQIQIKPYCFMREALPFDFPSELIAIIVGYVNSTINPAYHIDERVRNYKLLKLTDQIYLANKLQETIPEAETQMVLYSHPKPLILSNSLCPNTERTLSCASSTDTHNFPSVKFN